MNKLDCLKRAKGFLESGRIEDLRYAALELRMCMEAITYEKLRSFSKIIPGKELETWQPPQAVRLLLEYDQYSDRSYSIYIGEEPSIGQIPAQMSSIGTHNALSLTWLRKHYNKIGSYLHFPQNSKKVKQDPVLLADYLKTVLVEVEQAAVSKITGAWFGEIYKTECVKCGKIIPASKRKIEETGHTKCLNSSCGAEYFVWLEDGKAHFKLEVTIFECIECKAPNPIENRMLKTNYQFPCVKCGQLHQIAQRLWSYEKPVTTE